MTSRHTKPTNKEHRSIIMHSKGSYKCQAPADEIRYAMKELSANAYKLLMFYYSVNTGWNFDDEQIAHTLGVSTKTMKTVRKELIDKKYLLIIRGSIDNYFIGKRAVFEWENPQEAI